ncbi:hypothetical protein ACH4GK_33185 [Streptomyces rimosus]|uniref:hypothetical protein n=1 Tax=Streptomyces rimosus TaxID=1927 RepID=UPI0004C72567|nr:hypothetical protein [Streptomyces rimosus]
MPWIPTPGDALELLMAGNAARSVPPAVHRSMLHTAHDTTDTALGLPSSWWTPLRTGPENSPPSPWTG